MYHKAMKSLKLNLQVSYSTTNLPVVVEYDKLSLSDLIASSIRLHYMDLIFVKIKANEIT